MMDADSNRGVEDHPLPGARLPSMDDLEAAQTLEGLRSEYGLSPRASTGPRLNSNSPSASELKQAEPLISLLTSSHPLISSAINGSVSAYATSKSYSPRFKSSAEFIERNIGSPVANTVGTVGRKTGVESGLRWALQRREAADQANPRAGDSHRAEMDGEKDAEAMEDNRMRSSSEFSCPESLPPYDDQKSPSYDEVGGDRPSSARQDPQTWQSRLAISTSGLGVAMSQESLNSLQYCLTWLRWANGRLGRAVVALQSTLREWEEARAQDGADSSALLQRIQAVKADVLSTLKQVVDVVSKYAGGALPENARALVRRHLTSLPHRFQVASTSNPPPESAASSSEATVSAHRILVLAQEGLDMMAQVSGVVNDTLVSAEHWCDRLGWKRPEATGGAPTKEGETEEQTQGDSFPADVKAPIPEAPDVQMTGVEEAA